ncbi:MAG: hypothetical protein PVI99_04230 [Anaerolineales bacterium]|jgi:hypothetical protein
MFYERKTKDRKQYYWILYPIGGILIFVGIGATAGFRPAFYVMGGVFFLLSAMPFITFWRTRNAGFLAVGLFQLFVGLVSVSAPPAIEDKSEAGLIPLFLVGMYASLMVSVYQLINRKIKWRGQEVFELAAMPIEDIGNSYTARPRPAGVTTVSKTEMIRFVDFITQNLIAFAFREDNRIVFVLTLPGNDTPYLLGLKKNYLDDTWVAIDYDGNVSVNITEEDYLLFKQDLNFDQLCESLGNVFIEFLELSKKGQEQRIIDRMNALRLSPIN